MKLRELLIEKQNALCARWLDAVLGEYGALTAAKWRQQRDRFANPIGHALVTGLPDLFEAAIGDGEPSAAALASLEVIVRFRSVQELAPSRAVGFLYKLRDVIREELGAEIAGGAHASDLAAVDARIEQLTLVAFDTYVRMREQVFRLRQDELKRSVASLLRRWHGGEIPEPGSEMVQLSPPPGNGVRR